MLRRAFLRAVGAAAVAAYIGVESFKAAPRVGLDELNRVVQEQIMPALIDSFFKESPLLGYVKRARP